MRNVLAGMEGDNIISTTINLNSFSDAPSLQPILENPLEKKSGKSRKSYLSLLFLPIQEAKFKPCTPGTCPKLLTAS